MHLSTFLYFLTNIFQSNKQQTESEPGKPVLRNYPHCGELWREENKECFWDCEWQPIPDDVLQNNNPFITTQYVRSSECFRDCNSVQQCLTVAQPIYDKLKQTGETNVTVIFETLYIIITNRDFSTLFQTILKNTRLSGFALAFAERILMPHSINTHGCAH